MTGAWESTVAEPTSAATPAPAAPPAGAATKWWQWLIVYPALGTSLFAAVPRVWEEYKALRMGVARDQLQLAQEQQRLWQANLECLQQGSSYEVDGPHNIVVRVTLCQRTGDTLLRYHVGDWSPIYRWVSLPVEKVKKP